MSLQPFEEVVSEHGVVVMRVCVGLLGSDDAANDAWSETFISAMSAYPRLRSHDNVRGWLVTIAHNKAIDQLRSRKRRPVPTEDAGDGATQGPEASVFDGELMRAIDSLAPKQRQAVVYRYLADMSYVEIGRLLSSNESAARRSAADGIAKLRIAYRKDPSS